MLDINDPRTKLIFQAGGYIGRLKNACRLYILQSYEERQLTFERMKNECIQLAVFSETVFPDELQRIKHLVRQLTAEIDHLSLINNTTEPGKCTVCNEELHTIKTYVKEFPTMIICKNCPKKLSGFINDLEGPTEVMWI
jgi:hypothetical protein